MKNKYDSRRTARCMPAILQLLLLAAITTAVIIGPAGTSTAHARCRSNLVAGEGQLDAALAAFNA